MIYIFYLKYSRASRFSDEMPDDRNGSYSAAIDRTTAQDPQILMLVLPNNNEEK